MKLSAAPGTPQSKSGPVPYRYASHTVHDNVWGSTRINPLYDIDITTNDSPAPQRWGNRIRRFLSHFSGPIIWALEISAVLLIFVDHSADFVDVVIGADFVVIVLLTALRATLGRQRKGSGYSRELESNMKTSVDGRLKRAITG